MTESEDREEEQAWRATHPDVESTPTSPWDKVLDKPWPQDWWVGVPELRMLLGDTASTAGLRITGAKRLDTLLAVADHAGYEDELLWTAVDDIRALIARIGG